MSSYVTIGRILKQTGLKGELKILPLTFYPDRFYQLSRVHIRLEEGMREFDIENFRSSGGSSVLKLNGINSREDAEMLPGRELMIPEGESPELPEDTYYYYQLIGLNVYTDDGKYLGDVTDIIETGGNDVYVVQGNGQEYLLPAIRDVVKDVNIESKRIIITPFEGLLE